MAVLMVWSAAYIAEDDTIVARIGAPVAGLALRCEDSLGRSPSLDSRRWLRNCGHECNGFVHIAA